MKKGTLTEKWWMIMKNIKKMTRRDRKKNENREEQSKKIS